MRRVVDEWDENFHFSSDLWSYETVVEEQSFEVRSVKSLRAQNV